MLSNQANQQPATPEHLFAAIRDCPRERLRQKLSYLPPLKCAEILHWLMERFELAGEALMDFANDVHLVFEQHSKKYDVIAETMATPQYTRAIRNPAKKARSNLNDKLLQDKKIEAVWGKNWIRTAEPCMLEIPQLGVADLVQILVPIRWR
jgi:hypothetical protein